MKKIFPVLIVMLIFLLSCLDDDEEKDYLCTIYYTNLGDMENASPIPVLDQDDITQATKACYIFGKLNYVIAEELFHSCLCIKMPDDFGSTD